MVDQAVDLKQADAAKRGAERPLLYFGALVAVMLIALAVHVSRDGVFACPAGAYGDDHFLAYCEVGDYGDYEHGAYWYGLEPQARRAAIDADVLFLGNSRVQFGFSGPSFTDWFDAHDRRPYLLGFGYGQNSAFVGPLIERLQPKARLYVINSMGFFRDVPAGPGPAVVADGEEARRYVFKKLWQGPHRLLCGVAPALCGGSRAFYRNRQTGEWVHAGAIAESGYPYVDRPADMAVVAAEAPLARAFIDALPVDKSCVIFTFVWTPENETETARALAAELGVTFIAPPLEGLSTFDGSHLDAPSVERWVAAFTQAAEPHYRRCLEVEG